ncbi:MAG: hypothetical protein EOR22_23665 [Mesorhizobium sp.]|nr:MAG: hypothetical protein EOR22_23665 [Mesorhizobium sp.]
MAYKSRDFILPRPRQADWQEPAEQSAWRLREQIVKQEEAEHEAVRRAERERKAAVEAAKAEAAAADKINSNAAPARHGVASHFD